MRSQPNPRPGFNAMGRLSELLVRCGHDVRRLPPADRAMAETLAAGMGVQLLVPPSPPER